MELLSVLYSLINQWKNYSMLWKSFTFPIIITIDCLLALIDGKKVPRFLTYLINYVKIPIFTPQKGTLDPDPDAPKNADPDPEGPK